MSECTKACHPYCCGGTFTSTTEAAVYTVKFYLWAPIQTVADEIGACYQ